MAAPQSKTVHEAFSRFFEAPSRESLRALLKEHVGELRNCDFKASWPDHASVAKHLLGIANVDGGCLVVGVKENDDKTLTPEGLGEIKDKADIINGVKLYLPAPLLAALEIGDFSYDASEYAALVGKRFQVMFVHGRPEALPFVAQRDGAGVRAGAIYIRREGGTEPATYEEVERLIAQRLAASPQTAQARDLKEHFEELKVLYGEIPQTLQTAPAMLAPFAKDILSITRFFAGDSKPNPNYPSETYQAFVKRMLDAKKALIENLLGVSK